MATKHHQCGFSSNHENFRSSEFWFPAFVSSILMPVTFDTCFKRIRLVREVGVNYYKFRSIDVRNCSPSTETHSAAVFSSCASLALCRASYFGSTAESFRQPYLQHPL